MSGSSGMCQTLACLNSLARSTQASCRLNATKQIGCPQSQTILLKVRTRALPSQLVDGIKNRRIEAQSRQRAKQQSIVPSRKQRLSQRPSSFDRRMPFSFILRNVLQVRILRQDKGRSLLSPSRQTRESVRTVADHGEVVRNRLRLHSELGHHTGFVADDVLPTIELNDSRTDDALAEIFVGSTNEHLLYALLLRGFSGGRSERVIRLKLDHRPHHDSHGLQRLFENRELREQLRSYAFTRLVSGIQIVAEGFHHMIGCDPKMGRAPIDHRPKGGQHTAHGADLMSAHIGRRRHGEKVPEQFVGPVDQVDVHATKSSPQAMLNDPGDQRVLQMKSSADSTFWEGNRSEPM